MLRPYFSRRGTTCNDDRNIYRESILTLVRARSLYHLHLFQALACCRATSPEERGPTEVRPARMIHGVSLRNCGDATRDGRVEPRETEAYSKQYVEVGRGEPARQYVDYVHTGLS
jgi:hypothetical protein